MRRGRARQDWGTRAPTGVATIWRYMSPHRAEALDRDGDDLTLQVSEQVRVAWLEATTDFRRLDVTARLVRQAEQSLRLAPIRPGNGPRRVARVGSGPVRASF